MSATLHDRYQKDIKPKLQKDLGLKNVMEVPKIDKICINIGIGSYLQRLGKKDYSFVVDNVTAITGQKPVVKHAKVSVSNFRLREGQPVGVVVTLRGAAAYNFLDKVINVVMPRVRDFRGISPKIFDKFGNCSFGFTDHTVFPEGKQPENIREVFGGQIVVVTTAKNPEQGKALLDSFGFPFMKKNNDNNL